MRIEAALVHAVMTPGVALFSNRPPPPASRTSRPTSRRTALFLIYADPGQGGESELQQKFYDAAREPKEIWLVPGAGHTGGIEARPAEYERRVVGFFDDALLDR